MVARTLRRTWPWALALTAGLCACGPGDAAPDGAAPAAPAAPDAPAGEPPPPADLTPVPIKGLLVGGWKLREDESFADTTWLDEEGLREAFTRERVSRRTWNGFHTTDAIVPVDRLLDAGDGPRVGYLYVLVMRDDESGEFAPRDAVLHLRHAGRVRGWLDGRLVFDEAPPDAGWADARTAVTLTGPYDVVLLKLGKGGPLGRSMDVGLRVTAPDGASLAGVKWFTMRPPGRPSDLDRPEWSNLGG